MKGVTNSYNEATKSYSQATQKTQFPKQEQGLLLDCVEDLNLTDYTCAVGSIVQPKNVIFASKISNNRIRLFLTSKLLVDDITGKNKFLVIKGKRVTIRPLIVKQQRIILANVCPTIPHSVLEEMIDNLNIKRSSYISWLKATISSEGYNHVLSERRQVYVDPEDVNKFPEILKVRFDNAVYFIFPSTDTIRCFECKNDGHIAKMCPNRNKNEISAPTYHGTNIHEQTNEIFPELSYNSKNESNDLQKMHASDSAVSELPVSNVNTLELDENIRSQVDNTGNVNTVTDTYEPITFREINNENKRTHSQISSTDSQKEEDVNNDPRKIKPMLKMKR